MFNYQDDDNDRRWAVVDKARRFKGCMLIAIGVVLLGMAGLVFYEDGWQSIRASVVMAAGDAPR